MKLPIGKLTITDFCLDKKEHLKFRRDLSSDPLFLKYGFRHIQEQLAPTSNVSNDFNKLMPNHSYLLELDGKLMGYLHLGDLNFAGIMKLEYGLHEDYRGQDLSYLVLKEVSDYLLNHVENLKQLRGDISIYNKFSINTAERVGYYRKARNDQNYDYRYPDLRSKR
ncbi:MAG TPA: GNAT family N-acetyltransferase [Candidatus Scybalousia intestinigallinarum]|nr:GNAT family N-acetyltransferase [Candidatus Scybalousia intestinigallinarum]